MPQLQQSAIDLVANTLTPDEQAQFADLLEYIQEFAGAGGSGQIPEGSIGQLLNGQPPAIRKAFGMMSEIMETPRHKPFEEKWSEADWAEAGGLDPTTATNVKAALDGQYVMAGLQKKMPPDAPSDAPPTRREQIEAALRAHVGRD